MTSSEQEPGIALPAKVSADNEGVHMTIPPETAAALSECIHRFVPVSESTQDIHRISDILFAVYDTLVAPYNGRLT